jgi:hypothetical protein
MAPSITVVLTADEARLLRAQQKVIDQQVKMQGGYKKVQTASKQAGATAQQSFGGAAVGRLKAYATGAIGVSTAIGFITRAFAGMKQEGDAAIATLKGIQDASRDLNQVARSANDLTRMQARADSGAMFSSDPNARNVARKVLADMRREGADQDFENVMRLSQAVDPESASKVGLQLSDMFKGKLSPMQAVELAFAASRPGVGEASFEETAKFLPTVAEAGSLTGASPEEVAALTATLLDRMAKGKTAASLAKNLALQMQSDPRLAGKGIMEGERIIREEFPEKDRAAFMKSKENSEFFAIIAEERGAMMARQREISKDMRAFGTPQSETERAVARAASDPKMSSALKLAQAERANEMTREKALGEDKAQSAAAVLNVQRVLREAGRSEWEVYRAKRAAEGALALNLSPEMITSAGLAGSQFSSHPLKAMVRGAENRELYDKAMQYTNNEFAGAVGEFREAVRELRGGTRDYSSAQRREQAVPGE